MIFNQIFRQGGEESHVEMIESLVTKAVDYGKTSLKLARYKALQKTSEMVSYAISLAIVTFFLLICMLFFSLGLAIWIGALLGNSIYGFYIVAAAYGFIGIFVQVFMHNWLKKLVNNLFIKQMLK